MTNERLNRIAQSNVVAPDSSALKSDISFLLSEIERLNDDLTLMTVARDSFKSRWEAAGCPMPAAEPTCECGQSGTHLCGYTKPAGNL